LFNEKEIEDKLRKELDDLVDFFGLGKELTVVYDPPPKKRKNEIGQEVIVYGEYDDGLDILYVYRQGHYERIRQTLVHEYFEYMLLPFYEAPMQSANVMTETLINSLTRTIKDVVEGSGKVLSEAHYKNKERFINVLTKIWLGKK